MIGGDTEGTRPDGYAGRRAALAGAVAASMLLVALVAGAWAFATGDFEELPSSPESVGTSPVSIAVADLDADSDRDLAVVSQFNSNVTILKNNGSGNFSQPASSPEPVGSAPVEVAVADLDGDADQDLAVANSSGNNVTILKNNGSGNFFEPNSSPEAAGSIPLALAVGDVDGDGDQDLAVANGSGNNVTILKNTGAGNFNEPASSPEAVGRNPLSIAVADLDGDGDRDLGVVNGNDNNISILKNNGAGNFVEPTSSPEPAGSVPVSVAAADLDGDADQDLAVADRGSSSVTVLKNGGGGNFFEPASSPEQVGFEPEFVAAADLDGGTDVELAVANRSSQDVTILKNHGNGSFFEPTSSPEAIGTFVEGVAPADLDGDGDRDLAVPGSPNTVTILRNR